MVGTKTRLEGRGVASVELQCISSKRHDILPREQLIDRHIFTERPATFVGQLGIFRKIQEEQLPNSTPGHPMAGNEVDGL